MKTSLSQSSVKLEPSDTLLFKCMMGNKTSSTLTLKNLAENTICFKVKTSAPKEFLVTPINGTIHSQGDFKVSISFVGPSENKNKGQKFLIEACIASDVSLADWKSGAVQFKLGTHFLVADEAEDLREAPEMEARRASAGASVYGEAVEVEEEKEGHREEGEGDGEKKVLTNRNSELSSSIEQLHAQIEKISHKLKFSKDIEEISAEAGGKYAIPHLALIFFLGLLLGYYILG